MKTSTIIIKFHFVFQHFFNLIYYKLVKLAHLYLFIKEVATPSYLNQSYLSLIYPINYLDLTSLFFINLIHLQ